MATQQTATLPQSPDQRRAIYDAYLQTPEWQAKRLAALERAGHRCQVCNSDQRLDVHHRTYERIFEERPEDLTVLCRRCHERFHKSTGTGRRGRTGDARSAVLVSLRDDGPGTTAQVAQRTGLSKPKVGATMASLRREGTVRRIRITSHGTARIGSAQHPWRLTR